MLICFAFCLLTNIAVEYNTTIMNELFCWNQQFLDWLKYQMQKLALEIHLSGSPSDGFGLTQNQRKFWLVWEINGQGVEFLRSLSRKRL